MIEVLLAILEGVFPSFCGRHSKFDSSGFIPSLGCFLGMLIAGALGVALGTNIFAKAHSANKAKKKMEREMSIANQQQADHMKKLEDMATEEANKAASKTPDVAAARRRNAQTAKGGASGTFLTGARGVDPDTLPLAKNKLLGA